MPPPDHRQTRRPAQSAATPLAGGRWTAQRRYVATYLFQAEDVALWPLQRRFAEALRMTVPKLPASMREEFAALLTAQNLVLMGAIFGAWAASHAFGVGEAVDVVLLVVGLAMIGPAIWQCARDLYRFVDRTCQAQSRADLDLAAQSLARVVAVLGVTVFTALVTRAAARLPRGRLGLQKTPPKSPARSLPPPEVRPPPRAYETFLPIDKVLQGDGAMAQAFRKAALDDWDRNYPQLNKWRRWNAKTRRWEKADQARASHMAGTDLAVPVVRRKLPVNTEIIQYQTVGRQLGIYLAYPGTAPKNLAILANARIVRRFVVTQSFEALETTAARFPKGKVPGVGGPGGGLQLIMPPDWERYVRAIWGHRP